MIIFKELIEKYPKWNDLRTYLEDDLFRISDENEDLCIIRYDKRVTKMVPHSKWFRSVVWNMKTNRPVCVAPPKASSGEPPADLVCQEMLDGFMINCFKTDKVYITSRSKLDASGKFYSNKSFRELFLECENNVDILENTFYSFLVQHKEHRLVRKIEENRVFVVHRGIVLEDGTVEIEDNPFGHIRNVNFDNQSWEFQGVVLKDCLGNRWRIRSDKYMMVRELRGNTANITDRFAQMYTQNLLHKYIEYYPEERSQFNAHLILINIMIKMIYDNYVEMHIKKCGCIVNKMFLPHIYNIHGMYLTTKNRITENDVVLYIRKQPWQRIAFLIKKCLQVIDF